MVIFGEGSEPVIVERYEQPDEQGTLAHGFIIWQDKRYAYRLVDWDEQTAREANIAANLEGGSWSWDILANQWPDMGEFGFNDDLLKEWKVDIAALSNFIESEKPAKDAEPKTDKAAELKEKWQTEAGQLWQIGNHKLICGDCTDPVVVARVMENKRASMCFTSPPYNAGVSAKLRGNTSIDDNLYKDEYDDNQTEPAYLDLLCKFTDLSLSVCDYVFVNIQVLSGNKHAFLEYWYNYSEKFADVAIWDKGHAAPQQALRVMDSRFEFVLVFGGNGTRAIGTREFRGMVHNVYDGNPQRHNENADLHAATFPLDLPEHFIKTFTNRDEVIYEPFCGTGTGLVACENLQRKARAIEISPAYVAVALERMSQAFPALEIKRIE